MTFIKINSATTAVAEPKGGITLILMIANEHDLDKVSPAYHPDNIFSYDLS